MHYTIIQMEVVYQHCHREFQGVLQHQLVQSSNLWSVNCPWLWPPKLSSLISTIWLLWQYAWSQCTW